MVSLNGVICIVLIAYIIIISYEFQYMEYFTSNSNLYLLGDSILDNEQYVLPF